MIYLDPQMRIIHQKRSADILRPTTQWFDHWQAIIFGLLMSLFMISPFFTKESNAQYNLEFQHVGIESGLSYGVINNLCLDKRGKLWISTNRGVNVFNGYTIEKIMTEDYPQLRNNFISNVFCDQSNRIWIQSAHGHLAMMEESRKVYRVTLYQKGVLFPCQHVLNSPDGGVILSTKQGFYALKKEWSKDRDSLTMSEFDPVSIIGLTPKELVKIRQVYQIDPNRYFFASSSKAYLVNFKTKLLERTFAWSNDRILTTMDKDHIFVYDGKAEKVKIFDLTNQTFEFPFENCLDQNHQTIRSTFTFGARLNANEYVFTTDGEGIYIYNHQHKTIFNHRNEMANPFSIGNNRQKEVLVAGNGWVFFDCSPGGLSYYNQNTDIKSQHVFTDEDGKSFGGYISAITTKDNNTYYLGSSDGLIRWERNSNRTKFVQIKKKDGSNLFKNEEVQGVILDREERIWAATTSQGIIVLNKQLQLVKHIEIGTASRQQVKVKTNRMLTLGPDGWIWTCGEFGVSKINPNTFEVDNFIGDSLSKFDHSFCYPIYFEDENNLWFGSRSHGLVHYRIDTKQTKIYTRKSGLINNIIFSINIDRMKNVYIGTIEGLNILNRNGKMQTIKPKDGLLFDRVEGILFDHRERIWIENDIGLICYNPKNGKAKTFNEWNGISIFGFRVDANFVAPNGEFVMGTPRGIQYFEPDSLYDQSTKIKTSIYKLRTKNGEIGVYGNQKRVFPHHENNVIISFETIDFARRIRTFYRYRLEGVDPDWIKVADQNSVSYYGLSPGEYTFRLQVSRDGLSWQEAENQLTFSISAPFYKQLWFLILCSWILVGVIAYFIYQNKKRHIEKQKILETELIITSFASTINSHTNVEALLWDVAKNCINKLHFHDCIIYLYDEQKEFLIQKAAIGPKYAGSDQIENPIIIPKGHGITGSVALKGVSEIVNNTTADSRYIVDDRKRHAELTVPIVVNHEVLGVIDTEHPQRGFFSMRHKHILETIAFLCANQIQKIKAEEDKQSAMIELLENKKKAVESKLQSLRLQMNPHFLFNALNSIQQMILANEDVIATKYLSRFSKLLRSILVHSDQELITLKEEMDILNLYVELESIRFRESFTYTITCDPHIEIEEIMIPSLLIQPFVENAIWHGLMHKDGQRMLTITFTEEPDYLTCVIEDNGVGREAARLANSHSGRDRKHSSKGILVSEERLKSTKNANGKPGSIELIDLYDDLNRPSGTRVVIKFSILN
ncbi:MAG: histidine kinase [Chitinophagaceae bacterium]|nr:histidine kinase [Chitinophagaceae bacterium]